MFKFGQRSIEQLKGVEPSLMGLACLALATSPIDFGIYSGMRTYEQQKELVASGASKTMDSKHLVGKAVDLVPYVENRYTWDMDLCLEIAERMREWAQDTGIVIRWGGVWDRNLNTLQWPLKEEIQAYIKRRKQEGKAAFIDAVHFELVG